MNSNLNRRQDNLRAVRTTGQYTSRETRACNQGGQGENWNGFEYLFFDSGWTIGLGIGLRRRVGGGLLSSYAF
ncbi:hypothetical protein ACJIZ3_024318 [Penstemon smallii]|uniref:Uncharacterized protein n=1 Tax=Penstemon smallii TaxID=265156 RepID=A0ABD3TSF0_9LAMI